MIYPEDVPRLLDISCSSGDTDMTEKKFLKLLSASDIFGKSACLDGEIVGYTMMRLRKRSIFIKNINVDYNHRRKGIGTALLSCAYPRLTSTRDKIMVVVPETLSGGLLFLKHLQFKAQKMIKGRFGTDDGILFSNQL